jgi:hypothetical protein
MTSNKLKLLAVAFSAISLMTSGGWLAAFAQAPAAPQAEEVEKDLPAKERLGLRKKIPYEEALAAIQKIERGLKKSKWKWKPRAEFGSTVEADGQKQYKPKPLDPKRFAEAIAHFEPSTRRFRFDYKAILEWTDGPDKYSGLDSVDSYDGKVTREYRRSSGKDRLPNESDPPGIGKITQGLDEKFLKTYIWVSGIGYCPPYFARYSVSDLMQRSAKNRPGSVEVEEISPTLWRIRVQDPQIPSMAYNLTYDIAKGGWVTQAEWEALEKADRLFGLFSLELAKAPSGEYYPKTMQFEHLIGKMYRRLRFTEFEVNAKYDDSIFTFEFPRGTRQDR